MRAAYSHMLYQRTGDAKDRALPYVPSVTDPWDCRAISLSYEDRT